MATKITGTYTPSTSTTPTFGTSSAANTALQNAINAVSPTKISVDAKYGPQTQSALQSLTSQGYTYTNGAFTKPTTGSNIVSSSAPVVKEEKKITDDVNSLTVPNVSEENAKVASEKAIKIIEDRMAELKTQGEADIAGIGAAFDEARGRAEGEQKKEKATTNVALFRAGGYLGTQASGVGVLNNLAQTHRTEIASLEAKKAAAIQEAKNATSSKMFELAMKKVDEVKDLDKEINTRRNKFFDQTIQLSQENRQKQAAEIDKIEKIGPTILESIAGLDEAEARDFIFSAATDLNMDPNLLMGEVNTLVAKKNEEATKQVYSLAQKYPSAGIVSTDTFEGAQQKVRNSREYRVDIAKAEADLANTNALINARVKDEAIDYSDPILKTYSDTTGEIVSSPSKARAVIGYADSILGGKEVVADDTKTLTENQIKSTDANKLVQDAFIKFKGKDSELSDATVWSWLSSPEAQAMNDEAKKQEIMANGKNPEDFGIY